MRTLTDAFEPHIGVHEYDGIVGDIQRWFYGDLYKGAWCATSVSYFANELGILSQIGGKNENVWEMMKACEDMARNHGVGKILYKHEIEIGTLIRRGTIVFNLNSGKVMTPSSSKHVTTAYADFRYDPSASYKGLGGNQSDMIKVSEYSQKKIYAIFIPDYADEPQHPTLRKGDKGDAVKELQADLNELGYRDKNGNRLVEDASYGGLTESAVKGFQKANSLKVDGICGNQTWGKIDDLLHMGGIKVEVKTLLNCRTGAGTQYPVKCVLHEGERYTQTKIDGDWGYLEEPQGWVNTHYVRVIN